MSSDVMRLSGISTGFDTEAMIEQIMSAYQTKIDNQNKKLTTLTWQQEAYRDVISKLTTFQNKYFDILNKSTYLMSPTNFSKFSSEITNKTNPSQSTGLKVTTTSAAVEGTYKLNVEQTATATTLTGASIQPSGFSIDVQRALDTSEYTLDDDGNKVYSFALDIKVGDVTKTIEYEGTLTPGGEQDFIDTMESEMNDLLKDAFGTSDGTQQFASVEKQSDGTLKFVASGNAAVIITEKTGDFGLATLSSKVAISTQSAVTGTNTLSVNVDGVVKSVSFEGVSSTYFDSRTESGNSAILAEYNQLKLAAYRKDNNLSSTATVTQDQLDEYTYTSTQAAKDKNSAALQSAMNSAFASEGVEFTIDGSYVTATKDGESVEFSLTATSGGTFGLTKGTTTNYITDSVTFKSMGIATNDDDEYTMTINGKEITLSADATVADLVSAVNSSDAGVTMSYSKLTNSFVITANDLGNGGNVEIVDDSGFAQALGLAGTDSDGNEIKAVTGQNAIFELNGVKIYHNSNTYTLDGVTFDFEDVELGTDISVSVTKDYSDVKQLIKDFVSDYNQLVDDVYGYISTSPAKDSSDNKYEPLTDAEKEDMTEEQIEKWETLAKQGVLYNDSTLTSIMSQIRTALYNAVTLDDGSTFGLYAMGIKTSSDYTQHGKLEIDEDAFDSAFENCPEAIEKLFTDSDSGILKQVDTIIDNAISTTRVSGSTVRGSLVRKAGLETGLTATNNSIYDQMQEISKRIQTLQDQYDSKEEYWWSVFTNLETMMSDFNSQMSYLSSYFGTGNYQ